MLYFMNADDPDDDVVASGDVSKAFLMADEYPTTDDPRYVVYRPHKNAAPKVWRLKGPLYGSRDSPLKWHESFVKFMTRVNTVSEMGCELDASVHGEKLVQDVALEAWEKFEQGVNEPCCFYKRLASHARWHVPQCTMRLATLKSRYAHMRQHFNPGTHFHLP